MELQDLRHFDSLVMGPVVDTDYNKADILCEAPVIFQVMVALLSREASMPVALQMSMSVQVDVI